MKQFFGYDVDWSASKKRRYRARRVAVDMSRTTTAGLKRILADFPDPMACMDKDQEKIVTVGLLREVLLAFGGAFAALLSQAMPGHRMPQDWSYTATDHPEDAQPLVERAANLGKLEGRGYDEKPEESTVLQKVFDFFQKPVFDFNSDAPIFQPRDQRAMPATQDSDDAPEFPKN